MSHQKFIVHTSNQLNVEVLGTKFNVKSRLQTSEVMLTEGKVKLNLQDQNNQQSVYLKPGELATLQNQQISTRTVVQKQFTSWVNNTLYFDRTTLQEVALIIQQTYGLQVIFTDPNLKDRELSGEISSATIDDVLLAISETFNLEVQRKEDSLIISHASKN